jgi:hypothetical protein
MGRIPRIIFEPKRFESQEAGRKCTERRSVIFARQNNGQCMWHA